MRDRPPSANVPSLTAHILNTLPVLDIAIEDPAIETVIDTIYSDGIVGGVGGVQ